MTATSTLNQAVPSPFGPLADIGSPVQHPLDQPGSLASRFRGWFVMSMAHKLWREFTRDADEDEGYYVGGDRQWSKNGSLEALNYLRSLTPPRTTVSINHIQAVVDVLVGYERQNRFDLKASPQGDDDDQSAHILSWLLKFQQDQMDLQEHESEGFEDGIVRGASAFDIGIDFTDHRKPNGKIAIDVLKPGVDVIWDPYAKKYDLSDARFVLKYRWVYVDDIIASYPEHRVAILAACDLYSTGGMVGDTSSGPPADGYGSTREPQADQLTGGWQLFWDPRDRRVLVIEGWWREIRPVWVAVNLAQGQIEKFESKREADDFTRADPTSWKVHHKQERTIKTGLVLPFTLTDLDEGDDSPYDNDTDHYPIVPYVAKRKGDIMYGVVRNLKDPQLVENKRVSQVLDILARWANLRPLYAKGTLTDPRDLEDHSSTAAIEWDPSKHPTPPGWFVPQGLGEITRVLVEVATQFKLNLREIAGINPDLLGLRSDDTSGIAIARRQAQGQVIATLFFDRFRWTRRIIGERLARRIQQVYTTQQVLRLIDSETGERVRVLLNPHGAPTDPDKLEEWLEQKRDASGRPLILRNLEALEYDVVIDDAPTTPSARATALLSLLEIFAKMPSILPAVLEELLTLADIPNKPRILRKVRAILAQQGIPVEGGAPMPGSAPAPAGADVPGVPVVGAPPSGLPMAVPPPIPPIPATGPGGIAAPRPAVGGPSRAVRKHLGAVSATGPV